MTRTFPALFFIGEIICWALLPSWHSSIHSNISINSSPEHFFCRSSRRIRDGEHGWALVSVRFSSIDHGLSETCYESMSEGAWRRSLFTKAENSSLQINAAGNSLHQTVRCCHSGDQCHLSLFGSLVSWMRMEIPFRLTMHVSRSANRIDRKWKTWSEHKLTSIPRARPAIIDHLGI